MNALFPEVEAQLVASAQRAAAGHAARRRRHWRAPGLALIAVLATASAGYAARGLWQPVLGMGDEPRPVAVGSAPDRRLLDAFAVLRREQTETDRGKGAQYALQFRTNRRAVQTAYVRQLGVTRGGQPIILVPVTNATRPGDSPEDDRLCLWVQDAQEGGGRTCAPTGQVLRAGLGSLMGPAPGLPERRALEEALAKDRREQARKQLKAQKNGDRPRGALVFRVPPELVAQMANDPYQLVGLVPDDVVRVTVGRGEGTIEVPVRDNVFQAEIVLNRPGAADITWFDARGRGRPGGQP